MKKIMAVVLLFALFALSAVALSSCSGGSKGLEFELNADGTGYTVVGIGTCEDTELVIPSKYEGLPVTAIADNAMKSNTDITSITIPGSVKTIGAKAFAYCSQVASIELGEGIETIGAEAFRGCGGLTVVEIPEGVKEVGDRAFAYCTHVADFVFPSTMTKLGTYILEQCKDIERVEFRGTKAQWYAVEVDAGWFLTSRIERVHCSDGVLTPYD